MGRSFEADSYNEVREEERDQRYFVAERVPEGDVPEEIRREWISVPLPVLSIYGQGPGVIYVGETVTVTGFMSNERTKYPLNSVVGVDGGAAVAALRAAGKDEAADFWMGLYAEKQTIPDGDTFVFQLSEGYIATTAELEEQSA